MCFPPAAPPRVYIHTLGCPKNEADSRAVARRLLAAGAGVESAPGDATHILLNTCGFITDAKEESIAAILEACGDYEDRQVLVMGCLVERYRRELEKGIPEVAGWFGLMDDACPDRTLGSGVASASGGASASCGASASGGFAALLEHLGLKERRSPPSTLMAASHAYLKISDGCDQPCAFCAIPSIKGGYHSVDSAHILEEADACLDEGARELVLVGQDTTVWKDRHLDLKGLIDLLAADDRVRRVRLMYLQPEHVSDALLSYMASQPKLCDYLDVPFQHAHPEVLRRMGRGGGAAAYLDLLDRARRLMPDVSVRSAFIVGYPGETERQFEALLDFVDTAEFDHGGGFVYSPEEGTPAFALRPRVKAEVALERLNRLTALLLEKAQSKHERHIGARLRVIVDSLDPEDAGEGISAIGRTTGQAPEVDGVTYVEGDLPGGTRPGDELSVIVSEAVGYDLIGTIDAS
jgi:ribosomal protein S12 methylthiotransferase